MITFTHRGNFNKIEKFFDRSRSIDFIRILENYGRQGVDALSNATPVDTALTSNSWSFKTQVTKRGFSITWTNSNVVDGTIIAVILQYGHGTRNGGYVQGEDYINPALRPIFKNISENLWKEITKL